MKLSDITAQIIIEKRPDIAKKIIENAVKRSFFRPSNIWRFIGLLISVAGLYVKTIIVYDFNNGRQITSNALYFSAGLFLALLPTLKEFLPYATNFVSAFRGNKRSSIHEEDL
ncbi:MAG: hypothetical protein L6Q54_10990 [Leptospiraceae bacterium]|nr:hypothetical protein [Leptospiraceae bacterium]MCK6381753.1 hypothetical protein [Leptospiraceae bacterium]